MDVKIVHGNDIWRSCRSAGTSEIAIDNTNESGILTQSALYFILRSSTGKTHVVGDDNTSAQRATNEEDGKSYVNRLERTLDVDARSL